MDKYHSNLPPCRLAWRAEGLVLRTSGKKDIEFGVNFDC